MAASGEARRAGGHDPAGGAGGELLFVSVLSLIEEQESRAGYVEKKC
jgi:hypothetical protein